MPSPVQSNCDAHDTIAISPIVMLTTPLQTGSTVLSGQWDTHNRTIYLSPAGVVLLTRPPPCRLLHIPVVLNDFHSRETTL
ncbi:hypothetical protein TNCV_4206271 [Trichonephila clavipes]|nr:hypothetical protein TNCV_4206271 [Trichonephila clavipes]